MPVGPTLRYATEQRMEHCRQLEHAGRLRFCSTLVLLVASLVLVVHAAAQTAAHATVVSQIHELFQQNRWQEIADLHPPLGLSPDADFEYGIALARLERWPEASAAFESGLRLRPRDPKFMAELAGVSFKQENYSRSIAWLRRSLQISPEDAYSLDFLATVFYLQGNLEAALKYWNRIGKPHINSIISEPTPELNAVLFDRAFTFSRASMLRLSDLRTTDERIRQLDVFSTWRLGLDAKPDSTFDLTFRSSERNGCAGNSWACFLVILGQTPAQTLNFSYYNIAQRAINVTSQFRWDGEKRRLYTQLELPAAGNPKWHLQVEADIRNENWALRNSFSGPAPLMAALNLKREVGRLHFTNIVSGKWRWFTTTELSNRDYHNVLAGNLLPSQLVASGFQLKQSFGLQGSVLRVSEHRLKVDGAALASFSRLWSAQQQNFSRLEGSLRSQWFPQHSGEKYEVNQVIRASKTFGEPTFDELFTLGVLGDTELLMRGHIATRNGKKGSAPLGRNYFVSNFEALRDFSPIAIAHVKVGPFVDTGTISDPLPQLGSHQWLWDLGLEARLQAFGLTVTLSYARDLRSGRNAAVATSP